MAVKGVEIENWLSYWLLEKKGIMKNSLKSRKMPVLEPEENNCQMKLLIPSFGGSESLPGGSPCCQICSSFWQLARSFWGTLAEIYWQWNSWNFWKQLNLSVLHCYFIGLTVYEVFYGKKTWARQCCCNKGLLDVLKAQQFVNAVYSVPFPNQAGITCENRVGGRKGSEQKRNYFFWEADVNHKKLC